MFTSIQTDTVYWDAREITFIDFCQCVCVHEKNRGVKLICTSKLCFSFILNIVEIPFIVFGSVVGWTWFTSILPTFEKRMVRCNHALVYSLLYVQCNIWYQYLSDTKENNNLSIHRFNEDVKLKWPQMYPDMYAFMCLYVLFIAIKFHFILHINIFYVCESIS